MAVHTDSACEITDKSGTTSISKGSSNACTACGFSGSNIPRGNDGRRLDHQDDRAIRRAGAMDDALGHDKSLLWLQVDRVVLEIDDEMAFKDEEEFIVV